MSISHQLQVEGNATDFDMAVELARLLMILNEQE